MIDFEVLNGCIGGNYWKISGGLHDGETLDRYEHYFPTITEDSSKLEDLNLYFSKQKETIANGYAAIVNTNIEVTENDRKWLDENVIIGILYEVPYATEVANKLGIDPKQYINSEKGKLLLKCLHIDLDRFIKNQESDACGHEQALQEIKNGKKEDHWIWWNFPQLESVTHGIHRSWETGYFGIRSRSEAIAYINNTTLRNHLIELCNAILDSDKTVRAIFGNDWIKVKSCMNLFYSVERNPIFTKVLSKI